MSAFHNSITSCDVIDYARGGVEDSIRKLLIGGKKPFILRNYLSTIWADKCMLHWRDPSALKSYLLSNGVRAGECIVKCEFGGNYMEKGMTIRSVCLLQLMDYFNHCETNAGKPDSHKAYLAQFSILNNEYSLLLDSVKPFPLDVINIIGKSTDGRHSVDRAQDNLYNVNIWFNGVNSNKITASPCHYDPFHNLLCQISGEKRVLLLSDELHDCLYLHEGVQRNTSSVNFDVINIDGDDTRCSTDQLKEEGEEEMRKYPLLFSNTTRNPPVRASLAVLHPGDALYIPLRWMHYCKSHGRSMSTNFWWL